jgi:hypothetical protein
MFTDSICCRSFSTSSPTFFCPYFGRSCDYFNASIFYRHPCPVVITCSDFICHSSSTSSPTFFCPFGRSCDYFHASIFYTCPCPGIQGHTPSMDICHSSISSSTFFCPFGRSCDYFHASIFHASSYKFGCHG